MNKIAQELRSRINPLYASQIGTESNERRVSAEEIERLSDAIERLELEAVAATVRMDNDAAIITGLRELIQSALSESLEYQQAADTMAAAHKVERDALSIDAAQWRAYKARKDAALSAGLGKSALRNDPDMKVGVK